MTNLKKKQLTSLIYKELWQTNKNKMKPYVNNEHKQRIQSGKNKNGQKHKRKVLTFLVTKYKNEKQ